MAINFQNNMSIDTSTTDVIIRNSNGQEISTIGALGTTQTGLPFATLYWNGNSQGDQSTYPANSYPGGVGGRSWWPGPKAPFNQPYYWNNLVNNRRSNDFICPVPGLYRMSINCLATGNVYSRNGIHFYPCRNGGGVGVNAAHMVGGANYVTIQSWITVDCNAGDALHWFVSTGMYNSYSGSWAVVSYCLLP